ncbi:hypothetical protein GGR58DRAFT_504536 [Xylaria digitata]|nr:hypothetical protein GGR58DRAFT_504536 [Xylaria digitata]
MADGRQLLTSELEDNGRRPGGSVVGSGGENRGTIRTKGLELTVRQIVRNELYVRHDGGGGGDVAVAVVVVAVGSGGGGSSSGSGSGSGVEKKRREGKEMEKRWGIKHLSGAFDRTVKDLFGIGGAFYPKSSRNPRTTVFLHVSKHLPRPKPNTFEFKHEAEAEYDYFDDETFNGLDDFNSSYDEPNPAGTPPYDEPSPAGTPPPPIKSETPIPFVIQTENFSTLPTNRTKRSRTSISMPAIQNKKSKANSTASVEDISDKGSDRTTEELSYTQVRRSTRSTKGQSSRSK